MSDAGKVAVQATRRDYYGLRHPCGDTLDERGAGEWPRDAFTFRLRDDKALRLKEDDEAQDDAEADDAGAAKTAARRKAAPAEPAARSAKPGVAEAETAPPAGTLDPALPAPETGPASGSSGSKE